HTHTLFLLEGQSLHLRERRGGGRRRGRGGNAVSFHLHPGQEGRSGGPALPCGLVSVCVCACASVCVVRGLGAERLPDLFRADDDGVEAEEGGGAGVDLDDLTAADGGRGDDLAVDVQADSI